MKKTNNRLNHSLLTPLSTDYIYTVKCRSIFQQLHFSVVQVNLRRLGLKYVDLSAYMTSQGFNCYSANGFKSAGNGVNIGVKDFVYFTRLYEVLGLNNITPQYMLDCYNEQQAYLKDFRAKREVNRLSKLKPVDPSEVSTDL